MTFTCVALKGANSGCGKECANYGRMRSGGGGSEGGGEVVCEGWSGNLWVSEVRVVLSRPPTAHAVLLGSATNSAWARSQSCAGTVSRENHPEMFSIHFEGADSAVTEHSFTVQRNPTDAHTVWHRTLFYWLTLGSHL